MDSEDWVDFTPDAHGAFDPQLFVKTPGILNFQQTSAAQYALSSVHQLSGHPALSQNGRALVMDPQETVYFCDLSLPDDSPAQESCVPAGFISSFGGERR